MNQADAYFTYLLKEYRELRKVQQKELKKLPPGRLIIREDGKHINYLHMYKEEEHVVRRGVTKNQEMIRLLARKKYLQESLAMLEKDIPLLEKLAQKHLAPVPGNIISRLPKAYHQLTPEDFLPDLRKKQEWADADFEQSTDRPEELRHITARGMKVRSKSEAIIADKLDHYGLPFRYEEILYIETYSFAPDFKVLGRNGIMYWEHCGMVNSKKYMRRHNWKMGMYEKAGIVPWKNLIVTYDQEDGGLDTRIIEAEIRNKLL